MSSMQPCDCLLLIVCYSSWRASRRHGAHCFPRRPDSLKPRMTSYASGVQALGKQKQAQATIGPFLTQGFVSSTRRNFRIEAVFWQLAWTEFEAASQRRYTIVPAPGSPRSASFSVTSLALSLCGWVGVGGWVSVICMCCVCHNIV